MVTKSEFNAAVETIQKALREKTVAYGLTTSYNSMHTICDELVISARRRPLATYYYDVQGTYSDRTVLGTQDNFHVTIMEQSEREQLDLKATAEALAEATKKANRDREQLLASQAKMRELEEQFLAKSKHQLAISCNSL